MNATPTTSTRTYLLVDDHAGFRRMVREFLPEGATAVHECGDGAAAVEAYASHHPDWTLMDIDMPGMDGLTATRAIRAADPCARIVIVTSHDTPDCRAEAAEAGASAFVPKENLCLLIDIISKS